MKLISDLQKDVAKNLINTLQDNKGRYPMTIESLIYDFNNNHFVIYNTDCYEYLVNDSNGVSIFEMFEDIKAYEDDAIGEHDFNDYDNPFKVCNYLAMIYFEKLVNSLDLYSDEEMTDEQVDQAIEQVKGMLED